MHGLLGKLHNPVTNCRAWMDGWMDAKCSCATKKRGTKGHRRKTAAQLERQQAEEARDY